MSTLYTAEDIVKIAQAPFLSGIAVSMVDLGLVSSIPEMVALSSILADAALKYPDNHIIQLAFSQQAIKEGKFQVEGLKIQPEDVKSGAIVDRAIAAINEAIERLTGKATDHEIAQYKEFVYSAADAVAKAAGSGIFGSGEKVSVSEAAALAKIKASLAI